MYETFFLQPFTDAGFDHQVHGALLQHSRAHPFFHILPASILNDDRFDSLQMQKMREHQPGGSGAHNSHLRAQFFHATILIPRALPRAAKIHFSSRLLLDASRQSPVASLRNIRNPFEGVSRECSSAKSGCSSSGAIATPPESFFIRGISSGLTVALPPSFSRPDCRFKTCSARTAFSAFRSWM